MNTSDQFIELIFNSSDHYEELQGILSLYEPLGFFEDEDHWTCSFKANHWRNNVEEQFRNTIQSYFPHVIFEVREIDQENWNANWEATITPQHVTDRIIISPSWHTVDKRDDQIVIQIDPKMSFGTGYHQTTRLMIRLLEKYVRQDDEVLDVGTGSGILAITAIKLGASYAIGIDNDECAVDNAQENITLNGVDEKVDIRLGSTERAAGLYDIIAANITKNDIINLLPELVEHAYDKSILIFSGILLDDAIEMRDEFRHFGLEELEMISEDEWAAFAVKTTI